MQPIPFPPHESRIVVRAVFHQLTFALVLLAFLLAAGCTKYPQVEFVNLKYVAALRTACSAKNAEWLAQTKTAIDRDHAAGTIGDEERAAYLAIVTTAESGDWKSAEEECVRFQKDQLAE